MESRAAAHKPHKSVCSNRYEITSGKKEAASSKIERMKKEIDSMNSKHPSFVQTTPYKSYHTSLEQVSINDVSLSPNKPVKPIEVIQPL